MNGLLSFSREYINLGLNLCTLKRWIKNIRQSSILLKMEIKFNNKIKMTKNNSLLKLNYKIGNCSKK